MQAPRKNRAYSRARNVRNPNSRRIREHAKARRLVARRFPNEPFGPSEDWHEPTGKPGYEIIVKPPGKGYRHVVTAEQVRTRLSQLPGHFLKDLEVVQLGRMTRKKDRFPCYGMQWGCSIYLYPFDESLEETFHRPPPQATVVEAKMYGASVKQTGPRKWVLKWTETSARDFHLNNVLVHELGHLLDLRNTSYMDMERYAEWFAIKYGYLASGGSSRASRRRNRKTRRRHHRT